MADDVPAVPSEFPSRVAVLEEIARSTKAALDRIELQLNGLGHRFDTIEQRIAGVVAEQHDNYRSLQAEHRADFRALQAEQRADFRWTLGIMIAWSATLLGVMAHGFKWI